MSARLIISIAVFSIISFVTLADAQPGGRRTLSVGDDAPGLDVETWVKGEFNPSNANVYVVEFWATWCGPCKNSIPHLTQLQEEYADDDLTIVGISTDADSSVVKRFVQKQGMKMEYTIGVDNRRRTERNWMDKAGIKGIPAIFIVDTNGTIQFIGRPSDEAFEDTLRKVMSGRYDLQKTEEAQPAIDGAKQFRDLNSWAEAEKHYKNAISVDNFIFARLYLELFEMLLLEQRDTVGAYKLIEEVMLTRGSEDPELLTWLASMIATDDRITGTNRRMDVAMKLAETALSFARKKSNPLYLSTIALVHFSDEHLDEAIEWQRKAYFSAKEKEKAEYKFTLDSYRKQQQRASASE
jgi:thiol-disulfide isomerase/thioredoxin